MNKITKIGFSFLLGLSLTSPNGVSADLLTTECANIESLQVGCITDWGDRTTQQTSFFHNSEGNIAHPALPRHTRVFRTALPANNGRIQVRSHSATGQVGWINSAHVERVLFFITPGCEVPMSLKND